VLDVADGRSSLERVFSAEAQDAPPRLALEGEGLQRVPLTARWRRTRLSGRSSPEKVFNLFPANKEIEKKNMTSGPV
jgi:hypothetical protein